MSALAIILDNRNHPLLIHDDMGKSTCTLLCSIIRRMQGWSLTGVFAEGDMFAGPAGGAEGGGVGEAGREVGHLNTHKVMAWHVLMMSSLSPCSTRIPYLLIRCLLLHGHDSICNLFDHHPSHPWTSTPHRRPRADPKSSGIWQNSQVAMSTSQHTTVLQPSFMSTADARHGLYTGAVQHETPVVSQSLFLRVAGLSCQGNDSVNEPGQRIWKDIRIGKGGKWVIHWPPDLPIALSHNNTCSAWHCLLTHYCSTRWSLSKSSTKSQWLRLHPE